MNHTDLMNLIQEERYANLDLPARTNYPEFEALNRFGDMPNIWDDLTEEYGRIPTPREYGTETMTRAFKFFTTDTNPDGTKTLYCRPMRGEHYYHDFEWGERLARSVAIRQMRSYQSYLVEDLLIGWLLEHKGHEVRVGVHENVDKVMGVDLAVHFKEPDYIMYVHITTKNQMDNLGNKEKRNQKNLRGYFKRDFTNHVVLGYEREVTKFTDKVNGLYIPNQHLMEVFYGKLKVRAEELAEESKKDPSLEESSRSNTLQELETWLSGGLWSYKHPLTIKGLWRETPNQTT